TCTTAACPGTRAETGSTWPSTCASSVDSLPRVTRYQTPAPTSAAATSVSPTSLALPPRRRVVALARASLSALSIGLSLDVPAFISASRRGQGEDARLGARGVALSR